MPSNEVTTPLLLANRKKDRLKKSTWYRIALLFSIVIHVNVQTVNCMQYSELLQYSAIFWL